MLSEVHDYPWLRIAAPFIFLIILFYVYYYSRNHVNRLFREGEIGYHPERTKKNDDLRRQKEEEEEEEEDEHSNLLTNESDDQSAVHKTDRYEWSQSKEELEVFIPLSEYGEKISTNELDVVIQPKKLIVVFRRECILNEEFSASVKADDSCWMLDNNTPGKPHLWLNLEKAVPSVRDQNWPSLFVGEKEIPVSTAKKTGPSVHSIDSSDPAAMREAIRSLKREMNED